MQNAKDETPPGWFPCKILLVDTDEVIIAKTVSDVPPNRAFRVLETQIKEPKP